MLPHFVVTRLLYQQYVLTQINNNSYQVISTSINTDRSIQVVGEGHFGRTSSNRLVVMQQRERSAWVLPNGHRVY